MKITITIEFDVPAKPKVQKPGPKPQHPEQKSDELFYANSSGQTARSWKTTRRGKVGYNNKGEPIPNLYPFFVKRKEAKAKIKEMQQKDNGDGYYRTEISNLQKALKDGGWWPEFKK